MPTHPYRWVTALVLVCSVLVGCSAASVPGFGSLSPAMVVSVSEDGRYVVSSHREKELVLWDIEQRRHELISDHANIYSAYFIQGRDAFLWQDLEDVVLVQSVAGEVLQRFEHFPTYGHVMSADLDTYVASDEGWGIYIGKGPEAAAIKATDSRAFLGFGKLLNLTLDAPRGLLLSAGYGYNFDDKYTLAEERARGNYLNVNGVALWEIDTRQPLHKLPGNAAKTHATLSPDGKYVLSGDENSLCFLWDASTGERLLEYADLFGGVYDHETKTFDKSGLIEPPADLESDAIVAVAFLDDEHFVQIPYASHSAVLFHVEEAFPLRYLDLGTRPAAVTSAYSRNAAIDTAPAARVLVTGQRSGGGINVYRFDPGAQTLERIWAPIP